MGRALVNQVEVFVDRVKVYGPAKVEARVFTVDLAGKVAVEDLLVERRVIGAQKVESPAGNAVVIHLAKKKSATTEQPNVKLGTIQKKKQPIVGSNQYQV